MSLNDIRENKILAKIYEFKVFILIKGNTVCLTSSDVYSIQSSENSVEPDQIASDEYSYYFTPTMNSYYQWIK